MRIGVVTTSYPRYPGDSAGNFVLELSQCIVEAGHEIEVIAAGDSKVLATPQEAPVVRVPVSPGLFYEGGAPDALSSIRGKLQAAAFSARLLKTLVPRVRHYDGIVAHWLAPCALAAVAAAPNLPIWAIAHGGDVALLRKTRMASRAASFLNRSNVHLNFVSRRCQQQFLDKAKPSDAKAILERSTCCPMGIHLPRLEESNVRKTLPATPTILFLGRLVPIKGVDVLLDALDGLKKPYQLIIAGAGPESARLQERAEALGVDVDWKGEVLTHQRDALLALADIVVIPSRRSQDREEGMPVVALEALAAGVQLVVADTGGLSEIPSSICHRVPAENVLALRSMLARVLTGHKAEFEAGHWLEERSWPIVAPRVLLGMNLLQ